jgi:hypothetical protein
MLKHAIPAPFFFLILLSVFCSCRQKQDEMIDLGLIRIDPSEILFMDSTNSQIDNRLHVFKEDIRIDTIRAGIYHLTCTIAAKKSNRLRDLKIQLRFMPDSAAIWDEVRHSFHWVPNLKDGFHEVMAQHIFRSPAIILTHKRSAVSVMPDLNNIAAYPATPYYLDLNFGDDGIVISYGLGNYKPSHHVYYEPKDSSFILPEKTELSLYIICSDHSSPLDILKNTNALLWNTFGSAYLDSLSPQVVPFRQYAHTGYGMGLSKYWVNGPKPGTGGITLSTFLDKTTGLYRGRDYKDDIWFHSWFNNARTAYGLYLWGKLTNNGFWMDKAISVMNLMLSSPQTNGFFPVIWVPEKKGWVASGQGGGPNLYHVPDNAWTAIWLLRFNDELKKIHNADKFLNDFALGLLNIQLANGSFPARIRVNDLSTDTIMANSASGAMATWFLEEMILRGKLPPGIEDKARMAVKRSLAFLEKEILTNLRFQDFEVFFSCAPNSINHFDSITWLYPNNTLSTQWSAEAFLKAYQIFNRKQDLEQGEYCLNILSLYQQVWSPPFIDFYAFGGFGAQNTDAEWSDARQAQFAETYLNYFLETRNKEYLQRSIAACRASFALMAIPENKSICPQNYKGTQFNGEFQGAMAENFGHSGYNERSGQSGFHWGTGSALTTAAILKSKLGDIYIDGHSRKATGIDGIVVRETLWGDTIHLMTRRLANLGQLKAIAGQEETAGKIVVLDNDQRVVAVRYYSGLRPPAEASGKEK